jgi:hypothetical protein
VPVNADTDFEPRPQGRVKPVVVALPGGRGSERRALVNEVALNGMPHGGALYKNLQLQAAWAIE